MHGAYDRDPHKPTSTQADCPSCHTSLILTWPELGQRITCHSCTAELEIVWLNPVELDWPPEDNDYRDE